MSFHEVYVFSLPVITAVLSVVNLLFTSGIVMSYDKDIKDLDDKFAYVYYVFNYLSSFAIMFYLIYYIMKQSHSAVVLVFMIIIYILALSFSALLLSKSNKLSNDSKRNIRIALSVNFLINLFMMIITTSIFYMFLSCECQPRDSMSSSQRGHLSARRMPSPLANISPRQQSIQQ